MPLALGFRGLHLQSVGVGLRSGILGGLVDASRLDEVPRRVVVLLRRRVVAFAVHVLLGLLASALAGVLRSARCLPLLRLLLAHSTSRASDTSAPTGRRCEEIVASPDPVCSRRGTVREVGAARVCCRRQSYA